MDLLLHRDTLSVWIWPGAWPNNPLDADGRRVTLLEGDGLDGVELVPWLLPAEFAWLLPPVEGDDP